MFFCIEECITPNKGAQTTRCFVLKNHFYDWHIHETHSQGIKVTFCPISSSLSPKTWRRSEWPKITQSSPQSLIMAGLEGERERRDKVTWSLITCCCPVNTALLRGPVPDFSSKRPLGNLEAVLSCDADLGIETGAGKVQVDGRGSAHHLWKQGSGTFTHNFSWKHITGTLYKA